jgi:Na+-transporting NADH:ubiquinone oxidoreductase subunit NqrD
MLSNTLLGCTIFLITNTSLLYTSHLLVRRFIPHFPPSVRLVAIGTLFYASIIVIFQALSPFHAITKTWVTFTCLLLAGGSHFLWGKHRDLEADSEPLTTWLRDGLSSRWAALIIICPRLPGTV